PKAGEGASGQRPEGQRGADKPAGSPKERREAGEAKPGGKGSRSDQASGKDPGQGGKPSDGKPAGEGKGRPPAGEPGEAKGQGKGGAKAPRAAGKGGKATPDAAGKRGEAKPDEGKGPGDGTAKGEQKGDRLQAKKATPKDVEGLGKDLGSPDETERKRAQNKLRQIARQADDKDAREEARRQLEKANVPDDQPGASKPPPPADPSKADGDSKPCEGKRGTGAKQAGQGRGEGKKRDARDGEAKKGQGGQGTPKGPGEHRGSNPSESDDGRF